MGNHRLNFRGHIKGITYQAFVADNKLSEISLDKFDVNTAKPYGIIKTPNTEIAYSKWVSPKRTRSYPFARIYNTYNCSKILTIIPILKDEGKDGDRDRIQYSTISWMNLLNIYIVLAYYETAEKSEKKGQQNKQKLTHQKFNNQFVKNQINQILSYHQSALHWNKLLFETQFTTIFASALDCYDKISQQTGIQIHSRRGMDHYLFEVVQEFEKFKDISLKNSQQASQREALTTHKLEHLGEGVKATFCIDNYVEGLYYLTPDEIIQKNNVYLIQECKNTSRDTFPKLADIQDGLFKLILFSNIDTLLLDGHPIQFTTRLTLTGKNIIDKLILPNSEEEIKTFINQNKTNFNSKQKAVIKKLNLEAKNNQKISIEIRGNELL